MFFVKIVSSNCFVFDPDPICIYHNTQKRGYDNKYDTLRKILERKNVIRKPTHNHVWGGITTLFQRRKINRPYGGYGNYNAFWSLRWECLKSQVGRQTIAE